VQGVGAALVVPSSLALLNGTLRVPDRAPGIGIWAGLASLGGLLDQPKVRGTMSTVGPASIPVEGHLCSFGAAIG
jgi:hypothetical protein